MSGTSGHLVYLLYGFKVMKLSISLDIRKMSIFDTFNLTEYIM